MNMVAWLHSETSARLILTLGHSLWQGLLIAILATLLNALLTKSRQRSPATTYSIWLFAFAALIIGPFITFALTSQELNSQAQLPNPGSVALLSEGASSNNTPLAPPADNLLARPNVVETAASPLGDDLTAGSPRSHAPPAGDSWTAETWRALVPYIAGSYAFIAALLLIRLIVGLYAGRSLRTKASAIQNDAVTQVITSTARQLRMRTAPLVLACQRVVVPTVVGVLKPVILLPTALISALPIEQLKSIIAHEMAHIKRWDHLVNVVQRTVEALLFFNPGMWWISRQLRIIREHCCDDMVVELGVCRTDYATMLLDVAELSKTPELQVGIPLTGPKSSLGNRIRRLLGASNEDVRLSRGGIVVLVLLLAMLVLGLTPWPRDATAEDSAEEEVDHSVADLGDGLSVELIGLTTHPSNPQIWWDGSGELLENAPYKKLKGANVRTDTGIAREIAFQVRGLPKDYITDLSIDGSGSTATRSSRKTGLITCAFTLPDGPSATTIRFSATPDTWDLAAAIDIRGKTISLDDNKLVNATDFVVKQDANLVKIAFEHSLKVFADGAMSVVVVDKLGEEHTNSGMSAGGNREGFQRSEFDFQIAANQVARFEVRFRRNRHIAVFEQVSMHAQKITNQSVKTIHVPAKAKTRKPLPPVDAINKSDTRGWGEVANGLQARLTPIREFWQQWEQPRLLLEVRNLTETDTTLRHLTLQLDPSREFLELHGLRQRYGNFEVIIDDVPNKLATQERISNFRLAKSQQDLNAHVPIVPAGKLIRMPVVLTGARNTNRDEPTIQAGRYPVTLKHMDAEGRASFIATASPLEILPHGIGSSKDYTKRLKEYPIYDSKILAGFVPVQSTIVYGATPQFNFVVRNPNNTAFGYGFGGDYRGTGRHDRFKIEIRTESDQLLRDPKVGANGFVPNFGGIMWTSKIAPHGVQSTLINANDFRTIPGPGTYSVKCEFDLRNGIDDTREFEQIVQSEFTLVVLPPNEENISTALNAYFKSANSTNGPALDELVNSICTIGKQQAVAGLIEMATRGDRSHKLAAIRGLGLVPVEQSRDALIKFSSNSDHGIQIQAIRSLGSFNDDKATTAVIAAFDNGELAVQQAAAESLGAIGNEEAIQKLLEELTRNTGHLAIAVLKGIGETKSNALVEKMAGSLQSKEKGVREAAVNALVAIGGPEAVNALSEHKLSPNLEFREYVIRHLVEKMRQPIDPQWLVPVLKSRANTNSNGHAPRLMRIYCKDRAAPAILSAMDFDNPKVRSRYNRTLVWDQLSCEGALAIPWIGDLNRDGTAAEIAKNKETLRILKLWVERDAEHPIEAPKSPWAIAGKKPEWGVEVDGLAIFIRTNRQVWPEGLPQVVTIEGQTSSGSSASFQKLPPVVEVEVDGEWYDYDHQIGLKVVGDWNAYRGRQFHDLQLDRRWLRKSDKKPLVLKPGKHRVRVRLSTLPEAERTGLATSPEIEIEVLKTSS